MLCSELTYLIGKDLMRKQLKTLLLTIVGLAPFTASAVPILHQIEFTVTYGSVTLWQLPSPIGPPIATSVVDATGRTYFGFFSVDSDVLLSDGVGKPGVLDSFYIQMESNIWGYNSPLDNSFAGFRGPIPGDPFCLRTAACLGAPSPGFDVFNGEITNLRGGVYGDADVPFVDFSVGSQPNTFAALGSPFLIPGTTVSFVGTGGQGIGGTMAIRKVPEPPALATFSFALLVFALSVRLHRRGRTS